MLKYDFFSLKRKKPLKLLYSGKILNVIGSTVSKSNHDEPAEIKRYNPIRTDIK